MITFHKRVNKQFSDVYSVEKTKRACLIMIKKKKRSVNTLRYSYHVFSTVKRILHWTPLKLDSCLPLSRQNLSDSDDGSDDGGDDVVGKNLRVSPSFSCRVQHAAARPQAARSCPRCLLKNTCLFAFHFGEEIIPFFFFFYFQTERE